MAKGKKTGGRDFKPGWAGGPGRPPTPEDLKLSRLQNRLEFERILHKYAFMNATEINEAVRSKEKPMLELIVGQILSKAFNEGDPRRLEFLLDRMIGKVPSEPEPLPPSQRDMARMKSFTDFCVDAGYPAPFPKQVEMMDFGIALKETRLLLGARNYGKTDYITILGAAYRLYLDATFRVLILTKEEKRVKSIVAEIAKALIANGVELEQKTALALRVKGLHGKDKSVEGLSIRSGLRGRHPDMIIMDDPVTDEDVSEATRKLVQRKYNEAHKLQSNILIIGQPAHAQDLYAKLRKLAELKKMEVPYGTIPELDVDLEAQRLAGVDENSIQASYFLKIVSDGSLPFEKINYIPKYPAGDSVAWLDPSHKGKDTSALSIFRQHFQGIAVVGFAAHRAWNHWLDEIVPIMQKYGVKKLCIETNGLGDEPVLMARRLLKGMGIGVVGRDSTDNKHAAIMAAGAYAHLIHLSQESNKSYTDQVVQYEYGAEPDDAPDSLARGLQWVGLIRGKA